MQVEFRKLPGVDALLQQQRLNDLAASYGHDLVVEAARAELEASRMAIAAGDSAPTPEALVEAIAARLAESVRPSLQPVINASGVIIHTNLGRALLSERARRAMDEAARAYSNLEYDLAEGRRGSRYVHASELLCRLTGAEAAVVVNNNAAALVLVLTALAREREVVISRSQLVEIGGGFRIPDVMAQSGARLVEVGTTNRTYLRDYEAAIGPGQTAALMRVHRSNFRITGFTAEPALVDMAALAHRYGLYLIDDLGSGTLLETAAYGLAHEPTLRESLAAGADLVTASGDKLLGGPQAGLILGQAELIEQLKKHPLIRALRVDKTTLAALQATLLAYLEDRAVEEIPVWRMISTPLAALTRRAGKIRRQLASSEGGALVVGTRSTVGGGSLPDQTLPSKAVALAVSSPDGLAARLRAATPPVIARIEGDRLLLDLRTVLPEQDRALVDIVRAAL
ncbi:MAG: L-seryl-tRNA(Sec) selenium transferase [Anaerolineae bacterium]